jgi:uncharacterized protein (TIGR00369 family)
MTERHYGVASREEIAGLSGIEMLRAMLAGRLPAPTMSQTLGFRLTEVGDGTVVFEGEPGPHLLNPLGSVHGGWALALIDSATGCSVHSRLAAGLGYTTVETKVNMTRPILADAGTVRTEGRVVSMGRQIATAEAYVYSADRKLLAHGTSTVMILHPR